MMDMRDHTMPSSTPPSSDHPMAQFFFSGQAMPPSGEAPFSNVTLVPSQSSSVNRSGVTTTNNNTGVHQLLNPEGRVSKPVRRRSRASRRTPTTTLNTDTTNFRAMVQQFTGGPVLPQFGSNSGGGGVYNYQVMRFQQQEQANYVYGGGGGGANVEMNLAGVGGRGGGGGGGGAGVSVVEDPPAPPNRQGAISGNREVNNHNYMF